MNMIIHAISDLHGYEPPLPGGDLLIIAGDCTARDLLHEWERFVVYVHGADYEQVIIVPGNHDGFLEPEIHSDKWSPTSSLTVLVDEPYEWKGIKIYGMPWTPVFCNWHFMAGPEKRRDAAALIPAGLDILITHGPAHGILDGASDGERCGCRFLGRALHDKAPKAHVFGHIHEDGGKVQTVDCTTCYNVSCVNEHYQLMRGVTEIIL